MDNNMINIDDLFRQRLGNAEEEQRPGSWLKMKELLDEQMPVAAPAAGNGWRRMIYTTAGILLLSTITVGSYQAYTAFRGDNISDDVKAKYAAHDQAAGAVGAVMNYADGKPVVARNGQAIISDTDNDVNTTGNTANTNAIVSGGNGQATTSSANVSTTTGSGNGIGNGQNVSNNSSDISETIRNNSSNTQTTSNNGNLLNNNELATHTSRADNSSSATNRNNSVTGGNNSATSENANQADIDAQMAGITKNIQNLYNSGAKGGNDVNSLNTNSSNGSTAQLSNNTSSGTGVNADNNSNKGNGQNRNDNNGLFALKSNNNPKGNTQPVQPKKTTGQDIVTANGNNNDNTSTDGYRTDSMKKIEMREHVANNGKTIMDTFDIGKVPVRKKVDDTNDLIAANDNRTDAAKDNVIIPNAADMQLQTEDGNGVYKPLVPNSATPKTTNSKKYYNNNRFDEMVKNAKLKLKGVKFYPGVVAGANMAMTQNGFTGFQLGVNGNLSFGNRWSLYSELKYMQRFNGGKDLRDDYNTGLDSFVSQAGVKVYTYDSVEHFFNFTNVSTIEMPIALKYNIKRFNVFGGVNLNYNLAINNDEIERPYAVTKTETSLSSGQLNYGLLRGKPTVSSADFSSRFTVGYLFGMSYEMSPAMQLDLRVTQAIWDNAKTSGEQTVTKELFNAPTLQFNMSYRFSQKPYKKFRQ